MNIQSYPWASGGGFSRQLASVPVRAYAPAITFGEDPPQNDPPKTDPAKSESTPTDLQSKLYKPFSSVLAFFFTHPRIITTAKYQMSPHQTLYKGNLLNPKHFPLFQPMQTISFKSLDGIQLKGRWLPASPVSKKTVIMGHGYTDDWRTMLEAAQTLRKNGYNALLFDFRAHGESGGKKCTLSVTEGRDIAGAVNFLTQTLPYKNYTESLFYMGHSMGASSMMMMPKALESYPKELAYVTEKLNGMILDSPFAALNLKTMPVVKKIQKKTPAFLKTYVDALSNGLYDHMIKDAKKHLGMDLADIKPADILTKHMLAKKPILLIHGTHDQITSYDHSQEIIKTLKANKNLDMSKFQFLSLQNYDHLAGSFSPGKDGKSYLTVQRGGDKYMQTLLAFLEKHQTKAVKFMGQWKKRGAKTA